MSPYLLTILIAVCAFFVVAALIVMISVMNSSNISKEDRIETLEQLLFECEEERNGEGNGRGQKEA